MVTRGDRKEENLGSIFDEECVTVLEIRKGKKTKGQEQKYTQLLLGMDEVVEISTEKEWWELHSGKRF